MMLKLVGAIFVVGGCGGFGFAMAAAHRREEAVFRQYILALEYMECELSCRQTALPQLCGCTANAVTGTVQRIFRNLQVELEKQVFSDVSICVKQVLACEKGISKDFWSQFSELGQSLGQFDLLGQLKGLQSAAIRARKSLEQLESNRSSRLRSYQTLGLCAGAALAILFL